jgi:chaperonin GroES
LFGIASFDNICSLLIRLTIFLLDRKLSTLKKSLLRSFKYNKNIQEVIMTLKPLDDRLVIEPTVNEETKVGGIYIPDTAKEKPNVGTVIAVGNDEELQELVKVGDKVLYSKYGGTEVDVEDKKYLIISRSDVLALVE